MDPLHCEGCQEIIGVYEPMRVILRDGSERTGSRLTLGRRAAPAGQRGAS